MKNFVYNEIAGIQASILQKVNFSTLTFRDFAYCFGALISSSRSITEVSENFAENLLIDCVASSWLS